MENNVIPIGLGRAAEETALSMMVVDETASETAKSVEKFNDVYFSDKFRARERLNQDEYARRRAKNKAAKKARRKNRG